MENGYNSSQTVSSKVVYRDKDGNIVESTNISTSLKINNLSGGQTFYYSFNEDDSDEYIDCEELLSEDGAFSQFNKNDDDEIAQLERIRDRYSDEVERITKNRQRRNMRIGIITFATLFALVIIQAIHSDREYKRIAAEVDNIAISVGRSHVLYLKSDGRVEALGSNTVEQCEVDGWEDIVAISAGRSLSVGLTSKGKIFYTGSGGISEVRDWTDIVSVTTNHDYIVGIKSDGTVLAYSRDDSTIQDAIDSWRDIVSVSIGYNFILGLKKDGTVLAVGGNYYNQCDVGSWTDIVAISAGDKHSLGLKSDGTVLAVGDNSDEQCNVDTWSDIVYICAGKDFSAGLKSDGRVVIAHSFHFVYDTSDWSGIVHLAANDNCIVGVTKQGVFLVEGYPYEAMANVHKWNIK